MASYFPQPDGSNVCCPCPDRVSPCDPCEAACVDGEPNTFCATFDGIAFNCGCVHFAEFSDQLFITGDVNGGYIVNWSGGPNWSGANDCALFDWDEYVDGLGCTETVVNHFNSQMVCEIWCLEDNRFQIMLSEGGRAAFWGTASSFNSTVSNEIGDTIACGETFMVEHPAAGTLEMHAFASGGTVILTDNCGACLTPEDTCFDNNECACANAGGTFVPFEHCGKCCVGPACTDTSETGCASAGGTFTLGDFCGTCP